MFGTVLEKLDNYFGRPFLLSRCFPWLLYLVANLAIASIEFPEVRRFVAAEYAGATVAKAFDFVTALIAIGVLAYATSPVIQAMTEFLEGNWIGSPYGRFAARFLSPFEAARRERLTAEYRAIQRRRAKLPKREAVIEQLKSDRAIGAQLRRISDTEAIERAEARFDDMCQRRWLNLEISREDFNAFIDSLSRALKSNCADFLALDNPADLEQSRRLAAIHDETARQLAPYALDIAEQLELRARAKRYKDFARMELAPTRLGNSAAGLRDYCDTRYGIAFEAFWPRFLLVVASKDAKLSDTIAASKIQLDFSILCFTLTIASLAGWTVALWLWGRSLWTAAAIFIAGPALAWAWLKIVQSSYAAFAEVARSGIDLHRFDLLDAMNLPRPQRSDDEPRIWRKFATLTLLDEKTPEVTYRSPVK
jgi:hypothetical protein